MEPTSRIELESSSYQKDTLPLSYIGLSLLLGFFITRTRLKVSGIFWRPSANQSASGSGTANKKIVRSLFSVLQTKYATRSDGRDTSNHFYKNPRFPGYFNHIPSSLAFQEVIVKSKNQIRFTFN